MNIMVFGSNREGRHGKGAALEARLRHGAVNGQPCGRQGNSYGIVTKELRRNHPPVLYAEVKSGVDAFLLYARQHPEDGFLVTPIGCGLAGFKPWHIAPLFRDAPGNVILPKEFRRLLK